jgi:serine/threonine-protein kinase
VAVLDRNTNCPRCGGPLVSGTCAACDAPGSQPLREARGLEGPARAKATSEDDPARTTGECQPATAPARSTSNARPPRDLPTSPAPPPEPPDPFVGAVVLGQYVVVRKLGQGAFGTVYLAEQHGLHRRAVIKVLRPGRADAALQIKRFEREAAILAGLDHHNLIRVYNFGTLDDGRLFLAMEHGGDRTLQDVIDLFAPLEPARALRIVEQVCGALHEAHTRGVIHRDLKPANLLVGSKDGGDWIKVVDVGIAKLLDEAEVEAQDERLTGSGVVLGSPAYYSPEQARGLPLDGRSDLYSLGCVLYEMLSKRLPISALSQMDYVRAHATELAPPLRSHGVHVPAELEEFVQRSMAKSPGERFASAREMGEAAEALRGRLERGELRSGRPRASVILAVAVPVAAALLASAALLWRGRAPARPAPALEAPARATASVVPVQPPAQPEAEARARALLDHLIAQAKTGHMAEALADLDALLAAAPTPAARFAAYQALGDAADRDGDSTRALKFFELSAAYASPAELQGLHPTLARLRGELGLPAPEKR